MKEIRIHPNVYTYRIMIVALCRCGQIKSAHDVFVEMIDVGIESNLITFNNLMHVHVKAGLSEKMDGSEVELNVNSYRILISLYCGVGHWNNVYKFFREMVEEKCLKSS
ncbi:hypothetical protein LguiA_006892 [Lonicera macranthoides]